MAKLAIKKGTTSKILHVIIQDSDSFTGGGKTGLAYNTASLACKYIVPGGTISAAITLEDISTLGTYAAPTSNAHMRIKEVSATSPTEGLYELHLHDDWLNVSGGSIVILLGGASGMVPLGLEIEIVDNTAKDVYDRVGAPVGASISVDIAAVAASVWNDISADTYTMKELMMIFAAVLAGKASGGPDNSAFRSVDDSATRVTVVADSNGDRTSITINVE